MYSGISRRIVFILLGLIILTPHTFAFASMEINEVMYDLPGGDDGREWVEVYNNSDTTIDFSTFKFFEGDTNHKLKLVDGSANIPTRGYAVIVSDATKFKNDYPGFSGTIFDSTFSLNNNGESLAIKDTDLKIIDQYTYTSTQGGAGDGNSLQKINGAWVGALPTPGAENKLPPRQSAPEAELKRTPIKTFAISKKLPEIVSGNSPLPIPETSSTTNTSFGQEPLAEPILYIFPVIFLIFLGISAFLVFFIRKYNKKLPTGGDFELLE